MERRRKEAEYWKRGRLSRNVSLMPFRKGLDPMIYLKKSRYHSRNANVCPASYSNSEWASQNGNIQLILGHLVSIHWLRFSSLQSLCLCFLETWIRSILVFIWCPLATRGVFVCLFVESWFCFSPPNKPYEHSPLECMGWSK